MTLTPQHPPGRSTRKARRFEAEIGRLHDMGYSFEAIRQALSNAGVNVSRSTVQREVARRSVRSAPVRPQAGPVQPLRSVGAPALPDSRSGKDIAEDFVRNRITNPLLRNRS